MQPRVGAYTPPGGFFFEGWMFAVTPIKVAAECTGAELRVWVVIAAHADRRTGEAFPKQATIAKHLGISERAVRTTIGALRSKGLLSARRTQRGTVYTVPTGSLPSGPTGSSHTGPTGTSPSGGVPTQPESHLPVPPEAQLPVRPEGELPVHITNHEPTIEPTKETNPPTPPRGASARKGSSKKTPKPEPQPTLPVGPPTEGAPGVQIGLLHEVWQAATGRTRSLKGKAGKQRIRAYKQALEEHGFEEAAQLLRGLGRSEFHMENGYVEPSFAFRASNFDRLLALGAEPSGPDKHAEIETRWMDLFKEAAASVQVDDDCSGETYFRKRAVEACRVAGLRLVEEFGPEAKDAAREHYQGAVRDLRESLRKDEQMAQTAEGEDDVIEAADAW